MDIVIYFVKKEEKEILGNLLEKYHYEHSQYDNRDVNEFGLFGYEYLDNYWTEDNRFPFFIKINGKLAGFVLVNNYREAKFNTDFTISEFFIMYKYRQKGIGKYVVKYILDKYKGIWQLNFHPKNEISKHFWIKTIDEYTKGKYKIENDPEWIYEDGMTGYTIIFKS